jgi:hypothetical protein
MSVRPAALASLLVAFVTDASAANRAIEEVRLSRANGVATVDVVLSCPVEYLDHVPAAGSEITVRLELSAECVEALGTGIRSELHEPPRSTVAAMRQVQFDTRDGREARVTVRVGPPQRFVVRQGRAQNIMRIELSSLADAAGESRLPPEAPAAAQIANEASRPEPTRQPLRLVQRPAASTERFALQLASGADAARRMAAVAEAAGPHTVYVIEHDERSARWQELRLGFFSTEQEARAYSARVAAPYTNAIVVVAGIDEQERALSTPLPEHADLQLAETAAEPAATLSPARIETMTTQAGDAMLAGDHDTAIRLYARLLEEPSFAARAEARERLGLARERKGQAARARVEYEAFLAEFPGGEDAERVRQRLAGLGADAVAARALAGDVRDARSLWEIGGGVAQYVRLYEIEALAADDPGFEHSHLSSALNLVVRRHGERFEMLQRVDAAYHYNLLAAEDSADPEDQLHVSNAYLDVTDRRHEWQARVGRQSRFGSGIVGRFDGAHVAYRWRPDLTLNLALGHPVDHPRRAVDARRRFVGVSADLDQLVRRWDFSFFGILQDLDGIADREAVGAEARYRSDRWHIVGALDMDLSYAVLNSALVNASWRATDRLTLNGRFNAGAAPFIATRNALIGQAVVTVDTMRGTYSEAQLRSIARDRTAQAEQASFGLSRPVLDRFQLHADAGYAAFEGTVASAGVAALPDLGRQTFVSLRFVGSSLAKDGDAATFALRRTAGPSVTNDTLTIDWRVPMGARLRLNPRLALSSRGYGDEASKQWIAAPTLRLAFRSPKRHQLEIELGARRSTREGAPLGIEEILLPDEELIERFVNLGFWWELK